jgi:hypothetical protein
MRRIQLFLCALLLAFLCMPSAMAEKSKKNQASEQLRGIWQMCFYMSGNPDMPGELKPSNSFKILSDDGKFTNIVVIPNHGAIILGAGTYKQVDETNYVEHVEQNLHLPQLVGSDNELQFEMKPDNVMVLKYFVKYDTQGNEIDSWYYETWKKVVMPDKIPEGLVR